MLDDAGAGAARLARLSGRGAALPVAVSARAGRAAAATSRRTRSPTTGCNPRTSSSLRASGTSSTRTTQAIAPAAKPSPTGRNGLNCLDEQERGHRQERLRQAREDAPAGGCPDAHAARDEHEADREPFRDVVDRDRDRDEEPERRSPSEGHADADASVNEWTVITATIRTAFRASAAASCPKRRSSCPARTRRVAAMEIVPSAIPAMTLRGPRVAPSISRATAAESMKPAAIAFEMPSQRRLIDGAKRKGSAPRPVARAVTSAASVTSTTFGLTLLVSTRADPVVAACEDPRGGGTLASVWPQKPRRRRARRRRARASRSSRPRRR